MPTTEANNALPLNNYFAVQFFSGETEKTAIEPVFHASSKIRKFFRRLEVLDTFSVGSVRFLRCRTDRSDMADILLEVQLQGRGIVSLTNGAYVASIGGRTGSVSSTGMHLEVKNENLRRMYKGTKIIGWEMQFEV